MYYEILLLYSTVCRHKPTIPEACNIAYDCNINTSRPLLIPWYRNSPEDRNRLSFAHLQLYNNWKFFIGWVGVRQNTQDRQVWLFAFTGERINAYSSNEHWQRDATTIHFRTDMAHLLQCLHNEVPVYMPVMGIVTLRVMVNRAKVFDWLAFPFCLQDSLQANLYCGVYLALQWGIL